MRLAGLTPLNDRELISVAMSLLPELNRAVGPLRLTPH